MKINLYEYYQGADYYDENTEKALSIDSSHIQFEKMEDASEEGVKALENNEVIGFYNGRMEFGPRALCNRSIVYHCKDTTVNDWLNERRSEEHTSELQSRGHLVCRLLLE